MVVMVLEKVPRSLRGELSRWLIEIQTGVFVGRVSGLVRDLLWEKCVQKGGGGRCCQVWPTDNEQGFGIRMAGEENRRLVDLDGLLLVGVRRRVEVAEEDFGGPESD
ncbi:MAG: type I-E CRISPR-associated endoribonuclease Cas2e [Candidatus Acetothermia bacterium]|nr:type I-E CRISPR-associated endoribonuclease Cas2e [Candidatus Acetothermia bacterium]